MAYKVRFNLIKRDGSMRTFDTDPLATKEAADLFARVAGENLSRACIVSMVETCVLEVGAEVSDERN